MKTPSLDEILVISKVSFDVIDRMLKRRTVVRLGEIS